MVGERVRIHMSHSVSDVPLMDDDQYPTGHLRHNL
jgi:hypothetical protein